MQGGLVGSDEIVVFIVFVIIVFYYGLVVFQDEGVEELKQRVEVFILKVNLFLGEKVSVGFLGVYVVVIMVYVLILIKVFGDLWDVVYNNFMVMVQEIGDNLYWGLVISFQSNVVLFMLVFCNLVDFMFQVLVLWIEIIVYVLLYFLFYEGKVEMVDQIVVWFICQGSF